MKIHKILTKDASFQKLEVLRTNRSKRTNYGEFIVEGVRNINEAVRNNWKIVSWIFPMNVKLSDWANRNIDNVKTDENIALTPQMMREISDKTDTSELMAIVKMRDIPLETLAFKNKNPLIVLFDRPSNRGNLGTLMRSCDAFGADALITSGHGVDFYDSETIAATMGSFFSVPFYRSESNTQLTEWIGENKKNSGLNIIATTAHTDNGEKYLYEIDLALPTLLLIGNETDGLSRFLYEICDEKVTIPMSASSSASSLNVACAASVILSEVSRQRFYKNSHHIPSR